MSEHADHHEFQAHHFDDMEQQFDAGKLGMWLFLATEVLFFSGMFVAYTIYRYHHPEVFADAHRFLDKTLGGFNTIVLLASSLSVAWGVRCAQLDNRKGLVNCLLFTLACAGLFMGVKAVEYTVKFYEGVYWASAYNPIHADLAPAYKTLDWIAIGTGVLGALLAGVGIFRGLGNKMGSWVLLSIGITVASVAVGVVSARAIQEYVTPLMSHGSHGEHSDHGDHGSAENGNDHAEEHHAEHGDEHHSEEGDHSPDEEVVVAETGNVDPYAGEEPEPYGVAAVDGSQIEVTQPATMNQKYEGIFFSIYYAMTGVHALHILGGIGVIVWITGRSALGQFDHSYYGPVEYVGLYWHLVDLIWIFLFPLLYLIREPVV